jgi:hypothetical protein
MHGPGLWHGGPSPLSTVHWLTDLIKPEPLISRWRAQIHQAKGYDLVLISAAGLGLDDQDLKYRIIFLSSNPGRSPRRGRLTTPDGATTVRTGRHGGTVAGLTGVSGAAAMELISR